MQFTPALFKLVLDLKDNHQIDLRDREFVEVIGFDKKVVVSTNYNVKLSNIIGRVDPIFVHSDLVSDFIVNGRATDVILDFPMENPEPSYPFSIEQRWPMFNMLSATRIS